MSGGEYQREVERCRREMAEVERLLREGHPDIDGLCLALHDWAQELRILERERERRTEPFTPPDASAPCVRSPGQGSGAPAADRTPIAD
jgi:hypothetical protein